MAGSRFNNQQQRALLGPWLFIYLQTRHAGLQNVDWHRIGLGHSVTDTGSFKVYDQRVGVDAITDGADRAHCHCGRRILYSTQSPHNTP
ncbi:uncharacterized protein ARMOST_15862 [Armillaria ostoyae]|uniref:Uncharacterized protein n=1 Tax=Armillaria ostoyae TaxID=47428 RepID=A0A284RUP5_ARMOS|nr:uncharacterized protein ARMOST_15862 [Armillaria ostoyae]